jgi:PIN domain nuclease of toxin-antitoxin system
MRLLLDTHVFLWWVAGSSDLSRRARTAIADAKNECLVSMASAWEMAVKVSLGKLTIDGSLERFLPEQLAANAFQIMPIDLKHVFRVGRLAFHHRDPFDRLLAAQALEEGLTLISADPLFEKYAVKRLW